MAQLVGRDREVGLLQKRLSDAGSGRGAAIFIAGEAGVGKTRLVEECVALARDRGFRIMTGWCLQGSITPYMPIREALRTAGLEHLLTTDASPPKIESAFLVAETGVLLSKQERVSSRMDSDVFTGMLTAVTQFIKDSIAQTGRLPQGDISSIRHGDFNILAVHGRSASLVSVMTGKENEFLLNDMASTLAEIEERFGQTIKDWKGEVKELVQTQDVLKRLFESGRYEGIDWTKDDPKARQSNTFENVSLGILRVARTQPVLLFIDDLQWADPSTLAIVHYLTRNTKGSNVLIVGCYRPEDIIESWDGKTHQLTETMQLMGREDLLEKIELRNLMEGAVKGLVRETLGVEGEKEIIDLVWKESEGNPLFVIELIDLLKSEKVLVKKGEQWKLSKRKKVDVPAKIHDVIARRLARLLKEQKQLLEPASVIGDIFSSEVLSKVAEVRRIDLLKMLNEIERAHGLIVSMEKRYRFSHGKIRDVLYNSLSEELRKEFHLIVGDTLSEVYGESPDAVADVGYHYYMAKDAEKAVPKLMKAIEVAKGNNSNDEVARFCSYTLELMGEEKWKNEIISVLENLGDVRELIGELDEGIESFRKVVEKSSDPEVKARMHRKIASALIQKGEYDAAMPDLEKGKGLVKGKKTPEYGRILSVIGWVHDGKGEFDKAIACHEEALKALSRFEGVEKDSADAINRIGCAYYSLRNLEKSREYQTKGLLIYEKLGDQRGIAKSLGNLGNVNFESGEIEKGLECHERCLRICEKFGEQRGIGVALNNIGIVNCERGNNDKAIALYEKALNIMQKIGDQHGIAMSCGNMGISLNEIGEHARAFDAFKTTLSTFEKIGDGMGVAVSLIELGKVSEERGEDDRALDYFEKCIKAAEKMGEVTLQMDSLYMIAKVLLKKGRVDEAEQCANRSLELAKQGDFKKYEGSAFSILGMVSAARKEWPLARDRFEKAIEILTATDPRRELAGAYYEYGKALKRIGESAKAKEWLERALEKCAELKLSRRAEMIKRELEGL